MKIVPVSFKFPFSILILILLLIPACFGQQSTLIASERRILFQLQRLLEFPDVLNGWSNWTDLCSLPPSQSLTLICSNNHVTELTVIGNKSSASVTPKPTPETFKVSQQTLSRKFSIDSFFTTLTKLSTLKVLSLVSLGLWGELPAKINRFNSLQLLNVSSNFIYGEIPASIGRLKSLGSLVLAHNLFSGVVPDFTSLLALEEFDVGGNYLGPNFPILPNNLVSVVLKNNQFRSGIPLQLQKFNQLQRLDFSSNQLLGEIPFLLFSLPSIEYLNLAGNQLRGELTKNISCSKGLKFVDLSRNRLVGYLPACIRSNSSNKVVLFSWNCLSDGDLNYQHPNSFCYEKALAVKPPFQNIEKKESTGNKLGLIFGIAGAIMGAIVVVGLLIMLAFRRVRALEAENNTSQTSITEKSFAKLSPNLLTDARNASPAMSFGALGLQSYHDFSLEEIEDATNNFDAPNLIGAGSQGQLYKARLQDGSLAVVRCLKLKQRHSPQSILKYVEVMSKLRHRHLVSILGHCMTTPHDSPNAANTIFVVSEYVSDGTLRNHLTEWKKRDALKWPQRMAIAIGIARGIHYLHSVVTPGLVGSNLKIENILLDENHAAKISDYTLPIETMDYSETGERDDIYQLGVILLELVTGKMITFQSDLDEQRSQLQRSLTDSPTKLRVSVDPSIRGTFAYESLRTAIEIAINCLSKDSSQRPSVEDVLWNLQYSVQVQEGWTPSNENLATQL